MSLILRNEIMPATNFDALFDRFFHGNENPAWNPVAYVPNVDIKETQDAIVLAAELPGLDKKDVTVSVEKGVLTISGERDFEQDEKREDYHLVERNYGKFTRRFRFGDHIDTEHISAKMDKGVLTITLKKTREAQPRTIEVKVK